MATKVAHIRELISYQGLEASASASGYQAGKRLLDIVVASLLLVVMAPVMLLVSLAIWLDSRGPVVFRQRRVRGEQARGAGDPSRNQFTFYKFRTMYTNSDQGVHRQYVTGLINGSALCTQDGNKKLYKLQHDCRVTRIGRILRKTSLDELPQLVNVLRGDMSLVGPRPGIPYEVQQYKSWHLDRLAVRQGLTGLWQVRGRNELAFDDMVQLDIEYVHSASLWLDIKILLLTVPSVLFGRGVC